MNCKHCGAPLPTGALSCPYCTASTPYAEKNLEELTRQRKKASLGTLKNASLGLATLLYFFTFGFYGSLWYLLRLRSFNALDPKVTFPFPAVLANFLVTLCFLAFLMIDNSILQATFGLTADGVSDLMGWSMLLAMGVATYVAFAFRRILQNYAAKHLERSVAVQTIAPSGVMTFLFGALYLQATVNRMIAMELLNPQL
ncbi:MAG: zinc ribbon domain-containing protein [Fretibacterium sp.]|nr:zinc ribbon domain-containing protein [Fretibacterium sp.]